MSNLKKELNPLERSVFINVLRPIAKRLNKKISKSIPKYELQDEHIRNARLLSSREDLLKLLPQDGVVAELGVDQGGFSEKIWTITKPKKLHLIDVWGSNRYGKAKQESVRLQFARQIAEKSIEINLGLSVELVKNFNDGYFDWIYIDTSHSYETTIDELNLYSTKVKSDGIIAGHDYIQGNWDGIVRYGVIEAVHEFCVKNNWEILYLTKELKIYPSFAIRKIRE